MPIRTVPGVRTILTAAVFLATAAASSAQQQERKLIDRLLRPDMSLQNEAQDKQFTATGAISTKKATTKSFYVTSRSPEKEYTNVRSVGVKGFRTKESPLAQQKANTASRTKSVRIDDLYPTSAYATRAAVDAERTVEVSNYSGTRPFLGRGKSQKALSAQDRPLTIEQVRELLNKNK